MAWMSITLSDSERQALTQLADRECRHPRDQAALMLRHELQRLGLLPAEPASAQQSEARQ